MSSHTYKPGEAVEVLIDGIWGPAIYKRLDVHLNTPWHTTEAGGLTWSVRDANVRPAQVAMEAEPPPEPRCDCGGHTVGTHSSWCSAPSDNKPRQKGLFK